jgi:polysaccharide pyruvyl transferase WcaK-like protein
MIATVTILKQAIPGASIASLMQCSDELCQELGMRSVKRRIGSQTGLSLLDSFESLSDLLRCALWSVLKGHIGWDFKSLLKSRRLEEYARADMVIQVPMDLYSDFFGFRIIAELSSELLMSELLGKRTVVWATGFGPLRGRVARWLSVRALNGVDLITVREEESRDLLQRMRVTAPMFLTADPAFLLQAAPRWEVKEILKKEGIDQLRKPIIGVTPSTRQLDEQIKNSAHLSILSWINSFASLVLPARIYKRLVRAVMRSSLSSSIRSLHVQYVEQVVQIVNLLVKELNCSVIIIPHVQAPGLLFDDKTVAEEVVRLAGSDRVQLLKENWSARQIKGVIGECDLFIATRMHACVSALSQGIPTIAVGSGPKYAGIMKSLGLERLVCSDFEAKEVWQKVIEAWTLRDQIRLALSLGIRNVSDRALLNANLVRGLVSSPTAAPRG